MTKLAKAISSVCLMISAGPLMGVSAALAADPATQPAAAAPATQPSAEAKVLILPFAPVDKNDPEWIGKAVQQSLAADLARAHSGATVEPVTENTTATTTAEARAAGQKAGAKYVVFGSYQAVDPNLRITGQVLETDTGRAIAGLKSTGSTRDLFELQDTLSFQTRWGLGMEQLAEKKTTEAPAPAGQTFVPEGPVQMSDANRYPGSALSDAVNNDQSLIDQNSVEGQAYRESYYDNPAYDYGYGYPIAYGFYGYGYGGGIWSVLNVGYPIGGWGCQRRHYAVPWHTHDRTERRSDSGGSVVHQSVWHPMNGYANVNGYTPMTLQQPVRMTLQSPVLMTQQGGASNVQRFNGGGNVATGSGGFATPLHTAVGTHR